MARTEKVDAVIVGAGASGSVYAAVLAKAGKKVIILEQGPDWKSGDLISSDAWGRRLKHAGGPFILEGRHPVAYGNQSGWGVGGAALHYFANFPRLLPNDFKVKSEHGRALDWPISYQDLAPYYDKVARDVGVSGDAKAEEIWRPAGAPYPMPPMKTFRNGDIWLKGFEAVGIRMVPAAVGMNSTDYKGRPACIYDGWCHVGCPTGALSNPLVTYLGDARKAGAEVRPWSTVTRVLANAAGNRVSGVEYHDRNGEKRFQPANVVVLAAWAAQNPRIMLNSANGKHPKGLANSSGLVGKYMMTHFASGTWAIFDENVESHMGTTGAQYMSYDRYGKTSHKDAFGSTFIVCGSALKPSALGGIANARLDLFGPELWAFMKRAVRGLTRINAFGEELPNVENRVELTTDKDEFGMPRARITHSYDKDVEGVWNANFEEGLRVAKAAGAKESWSGRGNIPTVHLMGGTIMGTNAGNSVVNSFGQTHEIPNLYVAGPGIFPTGGAANPTYTIYALSLRGAERLAATWRTIAA
ncbi:MAG TPA: GMC family oxidoreductase [Burkholderiales bacterium]|nr:GMC family oxidoreductase [Burkholderiales bacterium]